jgi:hypothetical protein
MFTTIAFFAMAALAAWSEHSSNKERRSPFLFDDDLVRQSVVFARQDLRLIAYVLAAILVMLGVIADKMH